MWGALPPLPLHHNGKNGLIKYRNNFTNSDNIFTFYVTDAHILLEVEY
jgi:hypothetical protein